MLNIKKTAFYLFTALIINITGCKEKEIVQAPPVKLSFNFSHKVDNSDLELNTIKYTNKAGNLYSIQTLKYFISNISVHKGKDSIILQDVHYIDADDNTTFSFSPSKQIMNGAYDYISLTFGLNEQKNITGTFVNPPESNMEWPETMGGGYHFMKLEGKYDSVGTIKNFNLHSGSMMGMNNYFRVKLNQSSFVANSKNITVNISMNINEWFANPVTYDLNFYADSATMMNMDIQEIIKKNGADVFSIKAIE